jgi:hypothetical protein
MGISKRTLETLVDLVEIKLGYLEVYDREDSQELAHLKRCRSELKTIISGASQGPAASGLRPSGGAVNAWMAEPSRKNTCLQNI